MSFDLGFLSLPWEVQDEINRHAYARSIRVVIDGKPLMSAGLYNLFIEQGATFQTRITVTTGGSTDPITGAFTPGPPQDLTGYTARMAIKSSVTDTTIAFQIDSVTPTTDGSQLVLGGAAGTVDIVITDEDTTTLSLSNNKGVYDLIIESPADVATRLLKGTVTLDPGVTPTI